MKSSISLLVVLVVTAVSVQSLSLHENSSKGAVPQRSVGARAQSFYTFSTTRATWYDAVTACASQGTHLAIINSDEEAMQVSQGIRDFLTETTVWVGYNDIAKEKNFVTICGEPMASAGYAVWDVGQPDNKYERERCVQYSSNTAFADENCLKLSYYVCEREA